MVIESRKSAAPPLKSWAAVKEVNNSYDEEIRQAPREGRPIILQSGSFVPDIAEAFGIVPIAGEWFGSIVGFHRDVSSVEAAEKMGLPHESCSYMRCTIGSMLNNNCWLGEFPKLTMCLGFEGICTMQCKWYEIMARYLNIPFSVIDVASVSPRDQRNRGAEAGMNALKYLERQLGNLVEVLESVTKQKIDEEKFIKAVVTHHYNSELWDKVMQLWRLVPSPITIRALFTYENLIVSLPARSETSKVLLELIEELEERVKEGIAGIPNERFRLMWVAQAAWYILPIFRYLEGEGATFSCSPYLEIWGNRQRDSVFKEGPNAFLTEWQEPKNVNDCIREAAKRLQTDHRRFPLEELIREYSEIADLGRADGVVFHVNRGCKFASYGQPDMRAAIREKPGIPCLFMEGSAADMRDFSERSVMSQVNVFLDLLKAC